MCVERGGGMICEGEKVGFFRCAVDCTLTYGKRFDQGRVALIDPIREGSSVTENCHLRLRTCDTSMRSALEQTARQALHFVGV
jgi:hypothetical protein